MLSGNKKESMLIIVKKVRMEAILTGDICFLIKPPQEVLLSWSQLSITLLTQSEEQRPTNTSGEDAHSFLVRQHGLVEKESTRGHWVRQTWFWNLVPPFFFPLFKKWRDFFELQFLPWQTREELCCTGMLGSVSWDKGTCRCLRANSPWSICHFLSVPLNAFYQGGSRGSKYLQSISAWVCMYSQEGAVRGGRPCICEYSAFVSLTILEIFCFYPHISSDTSICWWSFRHPWACGYW